MYNRYKFLLFATLFVLFGSLIGNLTNAYGLGSAGSATGDMVTGCAGVAAGGTTLKLGGRDVPPETILRVPNGQGCASGETSLNLASYTSTILVSANNSAATNGANLLAALASVSPADADHGYLIKLEPGQYDLGAATLTMKNYVDIEGSGEGITSIVGSVTSTAQPIDNGLVSAASSSELRFLTVNNRASGSIKAAAIFVGTGITNFKMTHVTATASSGNGSGYEVGVQVNGGSALFQSSTLVATGTGSSGSTAFAINGGTIQILDSSLTGFSTGMIMQSSGGELTIKNSTIQGGNNAVAASSAPAGAKIHIGASQLIGAVSITPAEVRCGASYNGSFAALNQTTCA